MFSAPTNYPSVKPAAIHGHLLIFRPIEVIRVSNSFGESEAILMDLADLDTGEVHRSVVIYAKMIISGLRDRIGAPPVLATVEQGRASTGQSPPWLLEDRSRDPQSVAAADRWAKAHPEFFLAGVPSGREAADDGDNPPY